MTTRVWQGQAPAVAQVDKIGSTSGGTTGTIGSATKQVSNAGPHDWGTAANWSGGSVPVTGDEVFISCVALLPLKGV